MVVEGHGWSPVLGNTANHGQLKMADNKRSKGHANLFFVLDPITYYCQDLTQKPAQMILIKTKMMLPLLFNFTPQTLHHNKLPRNYTVLPPPWP